MPSVETFAQHRKSKENRIAKGEHFVIEVADNLLCNLQ